MNPCTLYPATLGTAGPFRAMRLTDDNAPQFVEWVGRLANVASAECRDDGVVVTPKEVDDPFVPSLPFFVKPGQWVIHQVAANRLDDSQVSRYFRVGRP